MAPRAQQLKGGPDSPDGQGDVTPERTPQLEYNADEKAKVREAAPITIGEVVYTRRRKNWKVTRGLRDLLRIQERSGLKGNRLANQLEKMPDDATDAAMDALEKEMDKHQDESDEAAYKIIALLLKDKDGEPPVIDHLQESLDIEDAGALASALSGGGQPVEGPTQTENS